MKILNRYENSNIVFSKLVLEKSFSISDSIHQDQTARSVLYDLDLYCPIKSLFFALSNFMLTIRKRVKESNCHIRLDAFDNCQISKNLCHKQRLSTNDKICRQQFNVNQNTCIKNCLL